MRVARSHVSELRHTRRAKQEEHWRRAAADCRRLSRCEQAEELKAYGADHVICTETHKIQDEVLRITDGFGAWGAIDAVAGDMTSQLQDSVKANGKVLVYGALAGLEYR